MSANGKDVIYVDVDDEITTVIDKVTSSEAKIVALVLPKRAAVFQSIVNMKLLKRRAEAAKKHIVLITSEAGLMPLAGNVGLHVAPTLQSKPEVPEAPVAADAGEEIEDAMEVPADSFDAQKEGTTPVGKLAGKMPKNPLMQMPEETVDLDNSDITGSAGDKSANVAAMAAAGGSGKAAKGKNKKLKVPNFGRFRLLAMLGVVALIVLIAGWDVAFHILPKATITIKTNTSTVNSSLNVTLDTSASAVQADSNVVPAKMEQQQKTATQQADATGKKNKGNKATGTVTITNCSQDGSPVTIPAGTGLSANGLTFITQTAVTISNSAYFGTCHTGFPNTSSDVAVSAQSPGAQYNLSDNTSFDVSGQSDVSASGSTSGGTDNIVQVVQQSDIDGAKQKLSSGQNADAIKQQLEDTLKGDGLYPLPDTFNAGSPKISSTAQAGDTASSVTVTQTTTYTMFGVKKDDLKQVLDASINKQIDTSTQSIQDDGLDQAAITVPNKDSTTKLQVSLQASATIGPHMDVNQLKMAIVGKKSGEVRSLIKANPGVTDVNVHYSPFWVTKAPSADKITIKFEKSSSK